MNGILPHVMVHSRDPWGPFRIWLALTLGVYAIRANFVSKLPGRIPGWVILVMVLISLALAGKALLFPNRIIPYRSGDGGWSSDLRDDWQLWWHRRNDQS